MRIEAIAPVLDFLLGPCVRRVPNPSGATGERTLYLTFDDGPDPVTTPQVLDLLRELKVPATFFVVGRKAEREPDIIRRILREGHQIGNHSYDHEYFAFFRGLATIKNWVSESERKLEEVSGAKSIGFRSPAGVRTPKLRRALAELKIPHILWTERFFDSTSVWQRSDAHRSLERATDGDIVLLHDAQKMERIENFLRTLRSYIDVARARGFFFRALYREAVLKP